MTTSSTSTPDALWSARAVRLLQPAAIVCRDVTRSVRGRRVLDRCSLSIPVGARLLLVSQPDEAASLLLRVLAGLARASAGRIQLAGVEDPHREGWARRVAYVGPDPGLYPWMSARAALGLAADLAGLAAVEAERRIAATVARLGLVGALDQPMTRGGPPLMQRVALGAALLAEPEVLLLDDPLRAVEPVQRSRMLRIPGPRRTVVMASRYPASEAGLVTHLALLRNGRVALVAALSALDERGLPLSMRGIEALADLEAAAAS